MDTYTLNCQRLINCRKQLGITKQEAAKRMQMSQPAYLRYESGERKPSIHVIQFMAHILGTSVNYLIGKTDNPSPDSYLVKIENEPELFDLITTYVNSDTNTQNRLLSYFKKLTEPNIGNNIR
jgi:transcriptional regulator with XRE-family HTH domain